MSEPENPAAKWRAEHKAFWLGFAEQMSRYQAIVQDGIAAAGQSRGLRLQTVGSLRTFEVVVLDRETGFAFVLHARPLEPNDPRLPS